MHGSDGLPDRNNNINFHWSFLLYVTRCPYYI